MPPHGWRKPNAPYLRPEKERNPEKYAARLVVTRAVRRGELARISTCRCVNCGRKAWVYHHHRGYTDPLDVVPMCAACHAKEAHVA